MGSFRSSTCRAWVLGVACLSCAADFDTTRATPPRGTLGHELFSLVCDRVGAQALREDVTGASFHAVCHADGSGAWASQVDASQLVPLDPSATDAAGRPVPVAAQQANRAHRIARIEALARRRADFARAIDQTIPAGETLGVMDLGAADPRRSCEPPPGKSGEATLQKELGATLGRMIDLYDDRTIPLLTEGLADVMDGVRANPDAQAALARFDARQGYRPAALATGLARPALAYPHLVPMANALLALVSRGGKGDRELQQLLATLHEELRASAADPSAAPLQSAVDAIDPARRVLSRPRGSLELARDILLTEDPAFTSGAPRWIVARDRRGVAAVALTGGTLPSPFVDADGDGLADVDPLGQFVTTTGSAAPSPFFAPGGGDVDASAHARDAFGRLPLYRYIDAGQTFAGALLRDLAPLLDPDPSHTREALMGAVGGLPVLAGSRDAGATSKRAYATGASLPYRAFHTEDAPLVDLVYAIGQVLAADTTDDTLAFFHTLAADHPGVLARLVGMGLQIKAIADRHPEAKLPAASTLWDELFDSLVKIAETPGVLEDLIKAFGKDETLAVQASFHAYVAFRDELTYDKSNLNGAAFNLTTQDVSPLKTPVDRSLPDTGKNRSDLQRFMQLLHDANGLGACTKDGAVAHVKWKGLNLDYPTDFTAQAACLLLTGNLPPAKLPLCGILRIENVAALLLDVALGRAKFDIRDPCLAQLVGSPLTGVVGGADAFLETVSGIKGFSTHPTVNGVSRLVYYDTPHDGLPGDASNPQTMAFLRDIIDPVPSMVCPLTPYTDPSDGKIIPLRTCASFADTLRGRDANAIFPLEQLDFIKDIGPLAAAFADHGAPLLFVELFDTLHYHWGSPRQSTDECSPQGSRATNPRWCSQDGAVSYEALLTDVLEGDLFRTLHDAVPVLQAITVPHCVAQDPVTHACTKSAPKDGVSVLADAIRALVDPARNAGLRDRHGSQLGRRSDGKTNPQVTPIYLLIDALHAFDGAFAARSGAEDRLTPWRGARSQLVDTFFSVKGIGGESAFVNAAIPKAMPILASAIREQVAAHCPTARTGGGCAWAREELPQKLADVLSGPSFAGAIDLLEAIRTDPAARAELQRFAQYLLTSPEARANDATASAAADLLQWLADDANLVPLLHAIAPAFARTEEDGGKITRRSLADAAIEVLARVLAESRDPDGTRVCARERDPSHAFAAVLRHLVTPATSGTPGEATPFEVLVDVVADVNRARPETRTKLTAPDYASIATEVRDFCVDPARGLEQVYEVIREATQP